MRFQFKFDLKSTAFAHIVTSHLCDAVIQSIDVMLHSIIGQKQYYTYILFDSVDFQWIITIKYTIFRIIPRQTFSTRVNQFICFRLNGIDEDLLLHID